MAATSTSFADDTPPPVPVAPPQTGPFDPFAQFHTGASWYDPDGNYHNGPVAPTDGTPYAPSAPIVAGGANGGTTTPFADQFNQFRGYTSAEGGTLGGYDPLLAGIANGDADSLTKGLASDDQTVRNAARSYALGRGSQGFTGSDKDYADAEARLTADATNRAAGTGNVEDYLAGQDWSDADKQAYRDQSAAGDVASHQPLAPTPAEQAAQEATDYFGQNDSVLAPNHVITPASETARTARLDAAANAPVAPVAPVSLPLTPLTPPTPFEPTDTGGQVPPGGFPVLPPAGPTDTGGQGLPVGGPTLPDVPSSSTPEVPPMTAPTMPAVPPPDPFAQFATAPNTAQLGAGNTPATIPGSATSPGFAMPQATAEGTPPATPPATPPDGGPTDTGGQVSGAMLNGSVNLPDPSGGFGPTSYGGSAPVSAAGGLGSGTGRRGLPGKLRKVGGANDATGNAAMPTPTPLY